MKPQLGLLATFLVVGPPTFFKYQREIRPTSSSGQHYVVVDETLWQHAQPTLNDVRLYSAEKESPYALRVESGSSETEQKAIRVLQPAIEGGKTQVLLDLSGIPEYDRIDLKLASKNFVAHARVEGQDDPHGARWAVLGTTTLYDLSEENLGHNSTLQIPRTTYKYLRVTIDRSVKPSDVQSGTAGLIRAQEAVWRTIINKPTIAEQGKDTVVTFSIPQNVPVERVVFEIDPAQSNFWREVEVQGDQGQSFGSDVITRIHMQRNGQKVDVAQTSIGIRRYGPGIVRAIIRNGDDLPLKITAVRLQQYERRIYFDSSLEVSDKIYYGDDKSGPAVYDYSRLFQRDPSASEAQLGAETANVAFTARPDERPWSERHPAVLWVAIVAAVLMLGGIAVRSMRSATT
jgi:hypothetical protein